MNKPTDRQSVTNKKINPQKSLFTMLIVLISFSILFFWMTMNFSVILGFMGKIISIISPIIYGFAIAFILNLFMRPLETYWDRIFRKHKPSPAIKRGVCILLSLLFVSALVFAVIFLVLPLLVQAADAVIKDFPQYLDFLSNKLSGLKDFLESNNINILSETSDTSLSTHLELALPQIGMNFVNTTYTITASVFSGIVNFIVAFVFAIYMLAQKETLCKSIKKIHYSLFSKKAADKILAVSELTNQTFTRFATGQFLEAVILGVLCFIGMLIFQFPYAVVISVLIAATALVPIVGAWIGIIAGALLILIVSPTKAFWFIIFVAILQQIEGNLIYPRVVGKSIGLPGILVLAAITVGGNLYGIVGMLLGVPIVSVLYVLLKQFIDQRLKEKNIEISA